MKTNNLNVEGKINIDGDVNISKDFSLSYETENGYIIGIPSNFEPNWFQRLLYKILGYEVIKKDGNI